MRRDTIAIYSKAGTEKGMISVKKAAKLLGVSDRRIRVLCEQGRIPGAEKVEGPGWILPDRPRVVAVERRRAGKLKMVEK